jgi:hypothetical protein
MNFALLKRGDKLPMVGVVQLLLSSTGYPLKVDGDFGAKTEAALKKFQGDRHMFASGTIDEPTWTRLTQGKRLPVVDCVDVFDPKILAQRVSVLERQDSHPLLVGGMQRGIQTIIDALDEYGGNLCLLRIVGHGAPGKQAVSLGAGGFREVNPHTGKKEFVPLQGPFEGVGLGTSAHIELVAPITRHLGPYGHLELHGCRVAQGEHGHRFLTMMARRLGVPVTAGIAKQPMSSAFRIVGHAVTAVPGGHTLGSWCASRPPFNPMTLP